MTWKIKKKKKKGTRCLNSDFKIYQSYLIENDAKDEEQERLAKI